VPGLHMPAEDRAGHRRLMSTAAAPLNRPRRWDKPFSEDTSEMDVRRLLGTAPFRDMNPESFPRSAQLADILRNDARLRSYEAGEIIVREGDYGTSAFMVLSGSAEVVLSPGLPPALVGRREPARRGIFRAIAQLWSNSAEDEVAASGGRDRLVSQKFSDKDTTPGIILQDIPRVLGGQRTAKIGAGDVFGEIAALSRMPRTATILASAGGAELLEIRWQGLRDLMRYDTQLRTFIDAIYRERALSTYLDEMPFMRYLGADAKKALMDATQFETYGEYDWSGEYKQLVQSGASAALESTIASEGDYPNSVVMVRAGFARVTQRFGSGHRTLNYLGSGRMYGFDEIAHNWRRPESRVALQHTLRVIGYTHVLVIPSRVIEEFVLPAMPESALPPLGQDGRALPLARGVGVRGRGLPRDERDDGVRHAEQVLQRDGDDGHRPRPLHPLRRLRAGVRRDPRQQPALPAPRARPQQHHGRPGVHALHGPDLHDRLPDRARSTGTCSRGASSSTRRAASAAPPARTTAPTGRSAWSRSATGRGRILVASDANSILKATKCDLCIDQFGGPACERACPHDALKRINLNTLDELVAWIHR
jgi:CRP-like cAMP-binding protein/ferredoxin